MRAFLLSSLALALSCAPASTERPLRSPSRDYPPEPYRTTADGQSLGADKQNPEDKLESGVRVDEGGPKAPGWELEEGKPTFNPNRVEGGAISSPEGESEKPGEKPPEKR